MPQHETPPLGGTQHQKAARASRRHAALMQAISQRGRALGLDAERVNKVQLAAEAELRRRGQHPDQVPFGDPVEDFDRYGI